MSVHVAVDLDGSIATSPQEFAILMTALRRGDGATVTVLTGNATAQATLDKCGVPKTAYDKVVVLPDTTLPAEKAAWCKANDVTVIIDNKKANCEACVKAGVALALIPVTEKRSQRSAIERARALLGR